MKSTATVCFTALVFETENKTYRWPYSKPVCLKDTPGSRWDYGDPKLKDAQRRCIKARRQAIRRKLEPSRTKQLTVKERKALRDELQILADFESRVLGVQHRPMQWPLGEDGKAFVPTTKRGKRHVPVHALPLNARNKRYVPSAHDLVEAAVFHKFYDKQNPPMAFAKLAAINPQRYWEEVRKEAQKDPRVRRAVNRVGSDVATGWPPAKDELLVLENFYATTLLRRPLAGMAPDLAVWMLNEKTGLSISVDRYRRILRKFLLR